MRRFKVLLTLAVVGLGIFSAVPGTARADFDGGYGCGNRGGNYGGNYGSGYGGGFGSGYGGNSGSGYNQQGPGRFGNQYGIVRRDNAAPWRQPQVSYGPPQRFGNVGHDFQSHSRIHTPTSYTGYGRNSWGVTQNLNSRYPSQSYGW